MSEIPAKKTAAKKTAAKKATEPTRRKRSLREKAEEALRIEQSRVAALEERAGRLERERDSVVRELASATRRRDFLAMDPALEEDVPNAPVEATTGPDA